MSDLPKLDYDSTHSASRFKHLKVIFPFSLGLLLGGAVAALMVTLAPAFTGQTGLWMIAIPVGLVFAAIYALTVLLLLGCFSSQPRVRSPVTTSAIIGIYIPFLAIVIVLMDSMACIVLSPPDWLAISSSWIELSLIILMVLVAPFLLVRWRDQQLPEDLERRRVRSFLKRGILTLVLFSMILGFGIWAAERMFNRDLEIVAAWVRKTHPLPGVYYGVALPTSQHSLTADSATDAVVLPDGRVVLLLRATIGWHGNWWGIIYASGPLNPNEIGTDAYGRPTITIKGIPYNYIEKTVDLQHFNAAFDLG